ncbi:Cholinesterase [Madurella mycetomatis]|uniref:Carboxylic ester hydrolase n=1 Tax=Madurella mycetomatis TaxID=100816 RepID=A0A175WCJ1_9PEZI|nr:Cholinesterase [Madurella mycetomatis]
MRFTTAICVAVSLVAQTTTAAPKSATKYTQDSLPTVDLGYELHQALAYNATTDIYKFSNIRYAQAPIDNLRFRAPLPPKTDRSTIQNGSAIRTCPQGVPDWQSKAFIPVTRFTNGLPFTLEAWENAINASTPFPPSAFNGAVTEDCLFLDLHVPGKVLRKAQKSKKGSKHVPVLVWIHGGGYTLSSKIGHPTPGFDPSGILAHAKQPHPQGNGEGMIFVSLNYRLGALGFLASPDNTSTPNTGLLDQRLALQWIQSHVHLFGGDPDRVTLMGESAGGGSIMFHISSYAAQGKPAPFKQAILQSPAAMPVASVAAPKGAAYAEFMALMNVSSLDEARRLKSEVVILANQEQIRTAKGTSYVHGPVVDGDIVVGDLGVLFRPGGVVARKSGVKIMAGHNTFEGGFFFDPMVKTEGDFEQWLRWSVTGLGDKEVRELMEVVYPPVFDGSYGYTGQGSRQMALWGEGILDCNFVWTGEAMGGEVFAYEFGSPGLHTQDLKYTFNDPANPAFHKNMQDILQIAIASFVVNGKPVLKGGGAPTWPRWGMEQKLVTINETVAAVGRSSVNETRCRWWQNRRL